MPHVSETIEFKDGHVLMVVADEFPESPREWDNLGTMICFHRNYKLGDEHNFSNPDDCKDFLENEDIGVILPLFLYDHGGITMSVKPFSCQWDSGQVGWIYVTKEDIKKEFGDLSPETLSKVTNYLCGEVKVYDQFIQGDVYGFKLLSPHECGCDYCTCDGEEVDSCWGFYGHDVKENGILDYLDKKYREEILN